MGQKEWSQTSGGGGGLAGRASEARWPWERLAESVGVHQEAREEMGVADRGSGQP